MAPDKMTPEQISKIAEDVRTIQKFQDESQNHGFNANLISATVVPGEKSKSSAGNGSSDWPMYWFIGLVFILLALMIPRYVTEVSDKIDNLLLVFSLLIGTLIVMAGHIKFKDKTVSVILSIGLFVVVAIGFGVLTPKEAIEEVKEMRK